MATPRTSVPTRAANVPYVAGRLPTTMTAVTDTESAKELASKLAHAGGQLVHVPPGMIGGGGDALIRTPQSSQSEPNSHEFESALRPPSSQLPSPLS